jgi:ABC-2 type transport system ATP-binding protein
MSILAEHLTKTYDAASAVDDISFEVVAGQIAGFLGPNGAGKSTTMKMLTGCLVPSSGNAWINGFEVQQDSMEARKCIGYLPESNPLYPDMFVKEYLRFHAGLHQLGKSSSRRISMMIEVTGLGSQQHKKIGTLSKGYRQRVGLAQALLHDPSVLILDEPTSGLDPNQLTEIRSLIRQLGKDKTVLLSTHILQEVQALCDRVIIINKGKIVADSPAAGLQQHAGKGQRILVEFSGPLASASLENMQGVSSVQQSGPCAWILGTHQPDAARKNLMEFALKNNLNIVSLQSSSASLEEIFRQLTDNSLT